jgi:hypothetical protein
MPLLNKGGLVRNRGLDRSQRLAKKRQKPFKIAYKWQKSAFLAFFRAKSTERTFLLAEQKCNQ